MERVEMVEKIREHADVSVEEARDVLERNNWDILDALVELEHAGKARKGATASTTSEEPKYENVKPTVSAEEEKERRKRNAQAFKEQAKKFFRILIDNNFVVKNKRGECIVRVPIIVLIICAIAVFWITLIVLALGLIFGFRYSFEGKELGKPSVNDGLDKVSDITQNIVNDITGNGNNSQDTDK